MYRKYCTYCLNIYMLDTQDTHMCHQEGPYTIKYPKKMC